MSTVAADASVARCAGKQGFPTRNAAERARPQRDGGVMIYRCSDCGQWHVGASNGRKGKRMRR